MTATGIPKDLHPTDLEHVPTIAELAAKGMARAVTAKVRTATGFKDDTRYQVSVEGQELIRAAMERNAARGRAWDAQQLANAAVDADQV